MKLKKVYAALIAGIMSLGILAGCAAPSGEGEKEVTPDETSPEVTDNQEEAAGDKYRIGFSMWEYGNSYFVKLRDGAQKRADELGHELIVADPNNNVAQQIADIENFIAMDVDAIIVCAIDPNAVDNALVEAQEKGIKVIAQSIEIENCDVFAATDEYEIGFVVGEGAGAWIADKYGEDAAIEAALFCLDSNEFTITRGNGMKDGILSKAPNTNIVARQDANTMALGQSVGDALLQAYPKLQVITCMNDSTAMGALAAVQAAGRDNEDFYIGGLDNTDEARAAIAEGTALRATLDNIPYENGITDIDLCVDLLTGKTVDPRYKIPAVLVTSEDIN